MVSVGAIAIVISAIETKDIIPSLKSKRHINYWKNLLWLMLFFCFGYLSVLLWVIFIDYSIAHLITGLIFMFGGMFVFLAVKIGKSTIIDLIDTTVSKEFVENIIKSMADTLIVINTDANTTINTVNNATINLLGYNETELIGDSVKKILRNDFLNNYDLNDFKNLDSILKIETSYLAKDGTEIPINFSASPLKKLSGEVEGLIFVAQDIRQKKLDEEKIKQYIIKLTESEKSLKELNMSKDKFFSIIAHDLKSPFTGLIYLTEMIYEDWDSFTQEELKQMNKELHDSAKNLFKLLQNLLEWSQMQKGNISFVQENFILADVVAQNVNIIQQRSEQKGILVSADIADTIIVNADKNMINTVLRNLISNAIKFTEKEGKVTISAHRSDNRTVEVAIKDTGTGMSQEYCNKLFKVEEKVGRHGTDGELSTGLGLLLCKDFVEKNDGRIWLESEVGKGSTFFFTIPLA